MVETAPMSPLLRSERDQLTLDLSRLRAAFGQGRRAAVGVFVLVAALGALWVVLAERTYDIDAIVVSADVPGEGLENLGSLATLAASVGFGNLPTTSVNESLALMTSRSFVGSFIAARDLKPKLFDEDWDSQARKWKPRLFGAPPTDADAYEYFMDEVLSVRNDPVTGLVTVRVTWRDPDEAAVWANDLIDRLNAEMRRKAIEDADEMMQFLDRELARTQLVSVKESIFGLVESQLKTKAVANVREEYSLRFIDRAISKDRKNFDHPQIGLVVLLVIFCAVVAAAVAGVAWGGWRASRVTSSNAA